MIEQLRGVGVAGLAIYLQAEIKRRGWSAAQLASKAGIDKSALNYIFDNPQSIPRLKTLNGLANALSVPLAHLITLCGFKVDDDTNLDLEQVALLRGSSSEYDELIDLARELSPERMVAVKAYILGMLGRTQQ